MTTKAKMILGFTHLLALFAGALLVFLWLGFNAKRVMTEGNAMMTQMALMSRYSTFADVMRTNGTKEEYKEALINFLKATDEAVKQPTTFYDNKMAARDKTLTYERLSRLEKEMGNNTKAEEYIKLATDNCNNGGFKSCSPEYITMISKKLEDKAFNNTTEKK
ncbi:MAG: hypothetical protein EPN25_12520 [Nitrospirae bacterium]|nr:MAG: hypothetical protein EPN25_12520 [Nitrospirota bacterium]